MTDIVITVFALIFSAFFSGYEISFLSGSKLKMELDRKQGKRYAIVMDKFIKNPEKIISSLLMGNNVALVIYGISMAKILDPFIEAYLTTSTGGVLVIDTVIATVIVLITAEFMPKALCRLNPNGMFSSLYWLFIIFYYLLYPLTYITNIISGGILKLFGVKDMHDTSKNLFDKSDLMHLSNEVTSTQEQENERLNEMVIFQNALNFSSVKLRECLIPRTEVAAVEVDDSIDELIDLFVEQGYSRIMVYKDTIDKIIGYVHSKDLLKDKSKTIRELLRSVVYVSEEMSAQTLLAYLTKHRKSVAVVRDEYGGTGGIVTLEDLIEEIFGNIDDELDAEEFVAKKISENEYVLSARLEVKEVNRKFDLDLPESDDYETIAGLITFYNEAIPKEKEILQFGLFSFQILKTNKKRIETVNLKVLGK
ncbi:MAG: HlyC/CorC family transporter [Bacteroidales bacterium]|nr:HlyC/CorC family transporter [Bacteroidales bacterium]MBO7306254.1 HlyC/CorC family transporter [Bacteroidales bacterium]